MCGGASVRPRRREKERLESIISRDLGIVCWSVCRPRRRENEVQESTICRDFGIVFWSLCRPRRRLKKGQVSRRSKSTFFILSAVFLSG